jgi:two-component sensor histidine kinase
VQASARGGEVRIEIVDNGVGVPEDLSPDRTQTLGMRLMQALTEQLEGRLSTERQERGTRSTLAFPLIVGTSVTGTVPSAPSA